MKLTIAIPNFKGERLLPKTLPDILKAGADEILIVDDFSKDSSVEIIKRDFPQVRLLENKKNLGFIPTVNRLFKEASGEIVVLLNNDVFINRAFLKPLTEHLRDPQVFAVNCHEEGEGWANGSWQNGFFEFKGGQEGDRLHKSSWASGGSAAFNKKIWEELGGFDQLYAPFYWEDIDISFRALKKGYQILWEPKAKVKHHHETTISKTFNKRYTTWVKDRNQLLFIWKNIKDPKLLREHRMVLVKRLLGGMGFGYWIPFLWALWKLPRIKNNSTGDELSDLKVLNYAGS